MRVTEPREAGTFWEKGLLQKIYINTKNHYFTLLSCINMHSIVLFMHKSFYLEIIMKKAIAIALICLTVISAVFAGGSKEPKIDNSLEELKARGEFVLGLDDSFPPLGFRMIP